MNLLGRILVGVGAVVLGGVVFHVLSAELNIQRDIAFAIASISIFLPAFLIYGFLRNSTTNHETD